jgi:hypothetical protein
MINGGHVIIYSKDAEADKAFIKNVLKFPYVDVNQGWLIFKLPPAEIAVHPSDENDLHEFYLMTDDLELEIRNLKKAGVSCDDAYPARLGAVDAHQAARRGNAWALSAATPAAAVIPRTARRDQPW